MSILALSLTFLAAQGQDILDDPRFDKVVSVSQPADRLDRSLKAFSSVAGVTLNAPTSMNAEILLIRLKEVPLRDAMKRIANACGGVWVQEKDTFYLNRAPGFEKKKLDALVAQRMEVLKKRMADRGKDVAKFTTFDAAAADAAIKAHQADAAKDPRNAGWVADEPEERMNQRLAALFDPTWLANASLSKRSVFSSDPNPMEQSLPVDMSQLFATYAAEEATWNERLTAAATSSIAAAHPFLGKISQPMGRPAKVLVITNAGDKYGNGVNVEVQFLDAQGKILHSANTEYDLDPDGEPDKKLLELKGDEKRLEVPPDDKTILQDLMAKLGGDNTKVRFVPFTPELLKRFKRPDLNEPLAGYVSQLLLGAADEQNLNVVADLPDIYLMTVGISAIAGMPTSRGLIGTLQQMPGTVSPVKVEGSWMEVDGATFSGFYAGRSDREALARLFTSWNGGTFSTAALADFAFRTGAASNDFMATVLGRLLSDAAPDPGGPEWTTLRLLGALQQLFGEKILKSPSSEIPFSRLDPDGRRILASIVYSSEFASRADLPPGFAGATHIETQEPEEVFPTGVPADGNIQIAVKTQDQVIMHIPGLRERMESARGIAQMIYDRDHPDPNGGRRSEDISKATFALGTTSTIDVTLTIGSIFHPLKSLTQHDAREATFVSYENLPASFKDEVQKIVATIK